MEKMCVHEHTTRRIGIETGVQTRAERRQLLVLRWRADQSGRGRRDGGRVREGKALGVGPEERVDGLAGGPRAVQHEMQRAEHAEEQRLGRLVRLEEDLRRDAHTPFQHAEQQRAHLLNSTHCDYTRKYVLKSLLVMT